MWLGWIFHIAFCSTSFVLLYRCILYIRYILKHKFSVFSIKELKGKTHLHLVMSWIQMGFNHIWNRLHHSHDSSIRTAVLIFHFHGSYARIKVGKKKKTSVFAWAFLSLVMHARYKRFNPLKWKVIMFSWLGVKTTQQGFIPQQSSLGQSTESSPTAIHVLPITYVDTCDKSYEIVLFF